MTTPSRSPDRDPMQFERAPSHDKPPLPPLHQIAARIRDGEALRAIAREYDRAPETIRGALSRHGYTRPRVHNDGDYTFFRTYDPRPWVEDRACGEFDPEVFFPPKGGSAKAARAICAGCPVRTECLTYAIENDEKYGVWGGLSEYERRKLRRGRKGAA